MLIIEDSMTAEDAICIIIVNDLIADGCDSLRKYVNLMTRPNA
jgi:hypothetical protein